MRNELFTLKSRSRPENKELLFEISREPWVAKMMEEHPRLELRMYRCIIDIEEHPRRVFNQMFFRLWLQLEVRKLKEGSKTHNKSYKQLLGIIESVEGRVDEWKHKNKELKKANKKLEPKVKSLQSELEKVKSENNILMKEVKKLRSDKSKLINEYLKVGLEDDGLTFMEKMLEFITNL